MSTLKFNWKLTSSQPIKIQYSSHYPGMANVPADIHSSIHIGLLIKGDTYFLHNGKFIQINENEIYLTAPWELHRSAGSENGNNLLLITADPNAISSVLLHGAEKLHSLFRIPLDQRQEILRNVKIPEFYIETILQLLQEKESPERELKLYHAALGIFVAIAVLDFPTGHDAGYYRLLPSLEKLGNRPISVTEAAEACCLSESRFAHLFRQVFGVPFAQYDRMYRLHQAFDQIQHEHKTLKEAAENWGFYDKSHFSKVCRQHFGRSPKKIK
ncbi:MAG: helix-turn-helix transcriptional regulator [Lentisphaerae bacterium]|nr:helix-turn-helix transcriptional regulator [Lentisphaerota bacterium]